MRRLAALVVASTLLALLAACSAGADQPTSDGGGTPAPSGDGVTVDADGLLVLEEGSAGGPGISITAAVEQAGGDQPLLVNGQLFIDADGNVLLCEALAESFPPQCAGPRLAVEGLDPAGQPDLQEANGIRWAEGVQLFGRVEAAS